MLGAVPDGLVSVAVEGKVAESFGPTLGEWQVAASAGKAERLDFLLDALHLHNPAPAELRYQLLHRAVSAILLARRLHAQHAVMIVQSFSSSGVGREDYRAFLRALGGSGDVGQVIEIPGHWAPTLSLAWVTDELPHA